MSAVMQHSWRGAGADARSRPPFPRDPLHLSLFALTFLNVSRLHQMFPLLGSLRPGLLLTGIALASAILLPQARARGWTGLWTTRVVAGIALVAVCSIPFGISAGGSFYFFSEKYYKVLVNAFLLMAAVRGARDIWFFSWAYVAGCFVLVYQALFVVELSDDGGMARLSNLFNWDANDLGLLLLVGIPLALLLWRSASVPARIFLATVMAGSGAAIARSGSRGAFIGLAAVVLAYLFSLKGVSVARKAAVVAGMVAALALAAPEGYWEQIGTLTNLEQDYNTQSRQGRKQLAIRGMTYMLDRPLFGLGIGNFGRAEGTISSLAADWSPGMPGIKWSAPHNSYVEAGAELGIPGLILFTTLVFGCIFGTRRLRRLVPRGWSSGTWEQQFLTQAIRYLPLASVGFGVPAVFLSFTYHDPIYILAALTGGLTAAVPRLRRRERRRAARRVPRERLRTRPVAPGDPLAGELAAPGPSSGH